MIKGNRIYTRLLQQLQGQRGGIVPGALVQRAVIVNIANP